MRVLFVTRKYPPAVGGMERFAAELYRHLPVEKRLVAHTERSRFGIIWIAPLLFFRAWPRAYSADIILLGDGVLAPVGVVLRFLTRKPVVAVIHGLELTYRFPLFRQIMAACYRRMDRIITVSENSRQIAISMGISGKSVQTIPNGVSLRDWPETYDRADLEKRLGIALGERRVLFSVGRLVARKGIAWCITSILGKLKSSWVYVVAGDGPEREAVEKARTDSGFAEKIILLGQVSEEDKELLMQTADAFLMPNISVPGDVEGFGIVAVEASAHGLPVAASAIDGIVSAVRDGKNGYLVPAGDADTFAATIDRILSDAHPDQTKQGIAAFTKKQFNWKYISHLYVEAFKDLLEADTGN